MSVGDYGTFVDSLYAEKTELRAVADQTGGINEAECKVGTQDVQGPPL